MRKPNVVMETCDEKSTYGDSTKVWDNYFFNKSAEETICEAISNGITNNFITVDIPYVLVVAIPAELNEWVYFYPGN